MAFFKSQCRICNSQHRAEVDRLLAEGFGLREVATRFNFSVSSVGRHSLRHLGGDFASDEGAGLERLIAATERELHRSERSGVMSALKLLSELKKRHRVASASSASPERPQKNPQDLIEALNQVYGLKGAAWDARLAEREKSPGLPESTNEKLIEQLRGYVERCGDTDPISGALCTRLASRILRRPLDAATEVEVSKLEAAAEGNDDMEKLVEKTDESDTDEGASKGDDESHIDSVDADDRG